MTAQVFTSIANSKNPFTDTCFGLTMLFVEFRKGVQQYWIEYQNEHGYTTQERVTLMRFDEYCK